MVVTGSTYRHYKGGMYKVIFAGRIIGTEGDSDGVPVERVLYESLNDSDDYPKGTVWRRSLDKFEGLVEVDGRFVPRFERVAPEPFDARVPGVRNATEADIDAITGIAREMAAGHEAGDPQLYSFVMETASQLDMRSEIETALARDDQHVFVSCDDSAVVKSFVICGVQQREGDGVSVPGVAVDIPFVATADDAQSQGHGARLIRAVKNLAIETGASRIVLRVWNFNERAIAFYERHGFLTKRTEMVAFSEAFAADD
jgi:ribosomal protein S18 acetylase RimI-like enzyme